MNVEITDNSKEVSGAIHQVGQAIADTGSLLQTWESLQQGHWHRTVVIRYSRESLRALRAFCKRESLVQQGHGGAGMRTALRLRRKLLSHLLPGAGPSIGSYPKRIAFVFYYLFCHHMLINITHDDKIEYLL